MPDRLLPHAALQDSGRVTPASAAADPNYDAEFIRNTTAASKGGLFQSLLQPIK